jgi:3-hydroxybutyryl-CoA dehydrogenase
VVRNSFGRRVAITGPLESADVAGLATMYHFGRSLMPDLDRAGEPAEAVARLVADGANGLANKRGVHDWTKRDGDRLLKARMAELFRWLKHDRERSR